MILVCPECGKSLECNDSIQSGQHVRCPYCNSKAELVVELKRIGFDVAAKPVSRKCELELVCSGQEYEEAIYKHLENAGYNCVLTPKTGDQGVDVVVDIGGVKVAIQCKLYSGSVGNDAVQEVIAGAKYYGCSHFCVVSNAAYTKSAQELAKVSGVRLLHHNRLLDYLSEFPNGANDVVAESDDWEASSDFQETMESASQGIEGARKRIADYNYNMTLRLAPVDLREAGRHFVQACIFGNEKTLLAYWGHEEGVEDMCYPPILDDVNYEVCAGLSQLAQDEMLIEFYWLMAKRSAEKANLMPLGRKRDEVFDSIPLANMISTHQNKTPKEMYYLGVCKLEGWGCERDRKMAQFYISNAATGGYIPAKELLEKM